MRQGSMLRSFVAAAAVVVGAAGAVLAAGPVAARPGGDTTTAVATGSGRSGDPVPAGFRAQSLSWVSPERGWALGVAPCGGGGGDCTTVIRTRDGGQTWRAVGAVDAPVAPPGGPGVTDLVFADRRHGWAFGPSLERTTDGGRSWDAAPLPGGGEQVLDLAAGAGAVYAVVSPCPLDQPPWECTDPPTLWRASTGAGRWRQMDVALPVGASARLAVHGRTAYVVGQVPPPSPDAFYATEDRGRTWSERPSPCDKEQGAATLTDIVPTSATDVALLCVGDAGFSKAAKMVFRSTDGARTTTPAGITPEWGILSELAATPGGTLAVASTSSGSWIYLNDTGGTDWTTVVEEGDGGAGWNDLTFLTEDTGWVVYAPVNWYPGTGTLLTTTDGGHTWTPIDLGSG